MRTLLLTFGLVGCLQAQQVARPANAIAFATSGQFVISTRNTAPPGQKAQPEIYEVVTGKDGAAAVTLGALGSVKMEANTQIRMPAAGAPQSLELLKGKLFLNIDGAELKKSQNTEFRLKTPAALLAVKGTQFFLDTSAAQEIIGVHEGTVAVATLAVRSTALLQKGQASSHGPSQPVRPRAMTAEEMTLSTQYAAPAKAALTVLSASGTTGMAEYFDNNQGQLSTLAMNDTEALEKLGSSVLLSAVSPTDCRIEAKEGGLLRVMVDNPGILKLRLSLTLRPTATAGALALHFYFKCPATSTVTVDGKVMKQEAAVSGPGRTIAWQECLLPTGAAEQTFGIEVERSPQKSSRTKAKQDDPILELSDFMLFSSPPTGK